MNQVCRFGCIPQNEATAKAPRQSSKLRKAGLAAFDHSI